MKNGNYFNSQIHTPESHSGRLERSCKPPRKPREFESHLRLHMGVIAQLDRALVLQTRGRGFEAHWLHHMRN